MGAVADRLRELNIELPPRRSYGKYAGAARAGDLVFVSGAGPIGPDGIVTGKVGADVDVADRAGGRQTLRHQLPERASGRDRRPR